ncbi:MAG: 2,5-diamino-6-(ribosylamino)-4(3H)-pyrimidinone 5'-phosphate reductase [Chloroflexi bacterium]|nr:2,5-diamino-6-(ribosylamino)-4(3H)-pyrimidinone 5'-phosphate reductase [Chloroflexota bacterium]
MNIDNRPHVFINVAMTADGKTDMTARQGAAISSPHDLARVDRLRAASDAIMVGGKTLLGEDPRLTIKSAELRAERHARRLPENPTKVGIVTKADLKPDSRFLNHGPARILIFTTTLTAPTQIELLRARGADVIVFDQPRVDLEWTLKNLKQNGVEKLMVEGGGTLNAELLRLRLVDEIYLYIAPLIFGGNTAPTFVEGEGLPRDQAISLRLINIKQDAVGGILLHYAVVD